MSTSQRPLPVREPPFFFHESTANEEDDLLEIGQREAVKLWDNFWNWVFSGNILQIAIGMMSVSPSLRLNFG